MKVININPMHYYKCGGEIYGYSCELINPEEVEVFDCLSTYEMELLKFLWGYFYNHQFLPEWKLTTLYILTKRIWRFWNES